MGGAAVDAGMGLSELTAFLPKRRCSPETPVMLCQGPQGLADACYGSEDIDQRDLLFQQVGRLTHRPQAKVQASLAAVGAERR